MASTRGTRVVQDQSGAVELARDSNTRLTQILLMILTTVSSVATLFAGIAVKYLMELHDLGVRLDERQAHTEAQIVTILATQSEHNQRINENRYKIVKIDGDLVGLKDHSTDLEIRIREMDRLFRMKELGMVKVLPDEWFADMGTAPVEPVDDSIAQFMIGR